jgi:hypothetical protein
MSKTMTLPFVRLCAPGVVALWCVFLTGCDLDDLNLGGGNTVSGTVHGESFQIGAGTAEYDAQGNYFITLSDSSFFDCFSSPTGNSLSVIIAGVGEAGTFSASGTVSFNAFENSVNYSEVALSGTVRIDRIDREGDKVIAGTISANGAQSQVSGDFRVPICD